MSAPPAADSWVAVGTVTEARDALGFADSAEVIEAAARGELKMWRPNDTVRWTVYRRVP